MPPDGFPLPAAVELRDCFGARPPFRRLPGGEGRTYTAGRLVFRREDNRDDATLIARIHARLPRSRAFRVSRPVPARCGSWVSPAGWSAWTFVSGVSATAADLPRVVPAVTAFHGALAGLARPRLLARRDSPYDRADKAAWGRMPTGIGPTLTRFVGALARWRRPLLVRQRAQIIHGDLNPDNILVAAHAAPALIDLAPYWRPPGFALAVLAYWLGPHRGDRAVLDAFDHVPDFPQLLVRAALRSVLIWHEFGKLGSPLPGATAAFERPVSMVVDLAEKSSPPRR
jgi:hypothetical protein